MSTFVATFDRIGRNHDVAPLVFEGSGDDLNGMAEKIYRYALPKLASREVSVVVERKGPDRWVGTIVTGQAAGECEIEREVFP